MEMRFVTPGLLALSFLASSSAVASSTSSISANIDLTLNGIYYINGDGTTGIAAVDLFDYEADGAAGGGTYGSDNYALGGSGTTSGSGSVFQNGNPATNPGSYNLEFGGAPMQIGDTISMSLAASATAQSGFVDRTQVGSADFSFLNYTDDGQGGYNPLRFEFTHQGEYFVSLHNDVFGDQAIAEITTNITLDDTGDVTTSVLPPIGEYLFSDGLYETPGGFSQTVFIDLYGAYGSFSIDNILTTPTYIQPVPLPAAAWLFGAGLLGFVGFSRKNSARV
ncbi:MAG: VPLPA-CTERM sorting domain-containing protein [Candidatus Thiodiazotropha taylori]|uniref:VPLPA-CTERM sorting domain-containing protein n=1 Tax=Candidatus Thiodiazotropha taylori TaxID=2792791 RepID=A0A9E4P835_9GAMM|nr:VPLPA-CTERM sorting domain-containing protein [Candidatus Thiodiazotropha taylori]MCG7956174.1 VPLPA-CTERM sorting domain-containing protein [Candidatus Thiodiazotropha taylori]MCG7968566.1 VPLPA-CTERM sorting domain-containing protein [Candidatus Thiodiazotropha taylori]MCG8029410.1 VPLPA-CTERM sorting domain-containing protein [Candidatus Thiodiazotropha taylori]MCG8041562.1 VPLPA-CTERM sorting domain-containing protein [Candidatus Thiodiazotropha taylori]